MRTIAIINQKGGVGKTTTVANLGAALARAGKRVVVFDMDPQANLSLYLGSEVGRGEASVYGVLTEGLPIGSALRDTQTPGLSLVASHLDLSGAELELASTLGRETLLRDALDLWVAEDPGADGRGPADFVLLDCPPSLGLLSINALVAANEVMIAVQTEFFALQGLSKLVEVIQLLRRRMNPGLTLSGIIPCLYDSRLKLGREVLAELRRFFHDKVFRHPIRTNVRLAESPSHGQTIFEYAPESNGALDYARLAEELLSRPAPHAEQRPSPVTVVADEQALELRRAAEGLKAVDPRAFHSDPSELAEDSEDEAPEASEKESAAHANEGTAEEPLDRIEVARDEPETPAASLPAAPGRAQTGDHVGAELAAYDLPRQAPPSTQSDPISSPDDGQIDASLSSSPSPSLRGEAPGQTLARVARQPAPRKPAPGTMDSGVVWNQPTPEARSVALEQELGAPQSSQPAALQVSQAPEADPEAEANPAAMLDEVLASQLPETAPTAELETEIETTVTEEILPPPTPVFGFAAYLGEDRWTQRAQPPR
ncbi:MAG TPA: AAA family ATPase [Planctomycetota bacterium]|nr:AAA family ATPase [Planctomycetota bacterium]